MGVFLLFLLLARSPAIDAGSDDAWGYDTTSTNPKVIDLGQPDIGYHYYRRVADDDPIMNPANPQEGNPDRDISISFRQPPILKDGLPIEYYRVGYSGISPDIPAYQVARFTASFYPGQDVIEASIVEGPGNKMRLSRKYDLEARTYVDDNTWSAPSVFTVIVKPENP